VDEAQQFLCEGGEVASLVAPLLEAGGWAVVSYRPDRIATAVMRALHQCLLTRLTDPDAMQGLRAHCKECGTNQVDVGTIPTGFALLCGGPIVQLRPAIRRVPHVRHLYKYLDTPLPLGKRFRFRDEQAGIGKEAASLYEFLQLIPTLPIESLEYHDRRQDFSHWAERALGDGGLAARLQKVSHRQLKGDELRDALRRTVASHYDELDKLR
jgi:hypothetical protein